MKPNWSKQKLGAVADLCLGKMLDQKKNKGEYHPYLGNIHVRWGTFNLEDLPQMRFESHEHDRYGLMRGDLVVCEGGEPGRCALWNDQVPSMKFQKALHRVRPHSCLDSRYLLYWFIHAGKRNVLNQYCTGSTIKHLPGEKLAIVEVDVPPLPIQRRIGSILSAYDELIENNTRRIQILERMAQALYREWFVNFRFPGHAQVKLVASPLGKIPQGWEVQPLESFCGTITDGSHFSPKSVEDGLPMASVKDMHDFGINVESCRKISREDFDALVRADCKPLLGDVLIAKDGSYLKHTFVVEKELDLVVLSSIAILRPVPEKVRPHFLALCLRDPSVSERMKGLVSGVAIPRIVLKDFRKFNVVLPPFHIQQEWADVVEPIVGLCCKLIDKNANLRRTRDLLLPKLISGALDVSKLDIETV